MENRFRIWDSISEVMIYPENKEVFKNGEHSELSAISLTGLPIKNSEDNGSYIMDEDKVVMRSTLLSDKDNKEVWAGDLRVHRGRLYKVVDDGWRFTLERNLTEFGENEVVAIDEDSAHTSTLIGNVHQNPKLLFNNQ